MDMFKDVVTSMEELRAITGYPRETVTRKMIHHLDTHCQQFIQRSPMIFLATSDSEGRCDVSPRGDHPGFVHIIDERHLIIPERPGNRRLDSLSNLLSNPRIGMIFMIPGLQETLRINGSACIVKEPKWLEPLSVNGKPPQLAIGVEVEECYMHCAKAFIRSQLWNYHSWPDQESLPNVSQIIADHVNMAGVTAEHISQALKESYEKRLY